MTHAADPALDLKLFFTDMAFWPEVDLLVDVGSGPLAHVAKAADHHPKTNPKLVIKPVDIALDLGWEDFLRLDIHASTSGQGYAAPALLFSSVLHEMFSELGHYGGFKPSDFWSDVRSVGPEYVIVRDMQWRPSPDFPQDGALTLLTGRMLYNACMGLIAGGFIRPALTISERIAHASSVRSHELVAKEAVELALKAMHAKTHPKSFDPKIEFAEHYFSLDNNPFVLAADAAGYGVLHRRTYTPDFVRDNILTRAEWLPHFTTHVEYVFERNIPE